MNRSLGTLDYEYFMRLDKWSKKDAALIISGFNPEYFKQLSLASRLEVPESMMSVHLLYRLFISINFRDLYPKLEVNPLAYVAECLRKDWPVATELLELAKQRYQKEYSHLNHGAFNLLRNSQEGQTDDFISKEQNYLSKILGVVVMLYVSEQNNLQKYGTATKPNVSAMVENVLQFLHDHDWDIYGLGKSNLHKKISQAVREILREIV